MEGNQNEMVILFAANWKLRITDDIFTPWKDIILKYALQQTPFPGSLPSDEAVATLELDNFWTESSVG